MPGRLRIEPASVVASAFKPSDVGKALILRLYNPSNSPQSARLTWTTPVRHTWLSSAEEEQGAPAPEAISVPKLGTVTLRVEQ